MKRNEKNCSVDYDLLPSILGGGAKKAPKWMDKQRKAVVTVTTYGKDNQKKASGTGFFITETGEALSGYSLFKDAARATVTDADGKEYPVSRILGADELYDVIKFKVEVPKKAVVLADRP